MGFLETFMFWRYLMFVLKLFDGSLRYLMSVLQKIDGYPGDLLLLCW